MQHKQAEATSKKLEDLFVDIHKDKLFLLFFLTPVALFLIAFLVLHNLIFAFLAALVGLILPNFFIKYIKNRRKAKLENQLIDGLVVLSSSLKAGLSLLQALEVVAEDMPPPISQEFSQVAKQIKIGMGLEEGLRKLGQRINSKGLDMMITSIIVASVTGGDLVKVFSRLIVTLRNNRKIQDNIKTLTLQGRMQGIILSLLPFAFVWMVTTFNRHYFDFMLASDKGRALLLIAVVLEVVGLFLIRWFSIIKI